MLKKIAYVSWESSLSRNRLGKLDADVLHVVLPVASAAQALPHGVPWWCCAWQDFREAWPALLAHAAQRGSRVIVLGCDDWRQQVKLQAQGAWVLPEGCAFNELKAALFDVRLATVCLELGQPERARAAALPAPQVVVNESLRHLLLDDECIPLQPRELALLRILAAGGPCCASTGDLTRALLSEDNANKRRLMAQHLHKLRSKLGRFGSHLEYSVAAGYRCWLTIEFVRFNPARVFARASSEEAAVALHIARGQHAEVGVKGLAQRAALAVGATG